MKIAGGNVISVMRTVQGRGIVTKAEVKTWKLYFLNFDHVLRGRYVLRVVSCRRLIADQH